MLSFEELFLLAPEIEKKLDYAFKNSRLLALAFIHRSYINENRHILEHNERLEFLGDSILGMLMAEYLYEQLPTTSEGELSFLRSRLVEAASCVKYVQKLQISQYLLLGKGERLNDGRGRESILADLFEAIVGAIYLDGGLGAVKAFLLLHFKDEFAQVLQTPSLNWKALLQDYCQKKHQQPPVYTVVHESGPDHSKIFRICVSVNDQEMGTGEGGSKKEAQQAAAADALARLNILPGKSNGNQS